ncbi:MAG: hypothetical protein ACTMIR_02565 [Cellulomonadaceae bacterium]
MEAMTTGALLADRYRLTRRMESDLVDVEAWHAQDQILERPVRVALLSGPRAAAALDEARRAALVVDRRLVRVLDVGTSDTHRFVVTEDFSGSSLATLVSAHALPADQARAVVGEAAAAIETARTRGLHHLVLRPNALRVTDGKVVVTGLGVDGALQGLARSDALSESRSDAVGLVGLLFYALTGQWPGQRLADLRLRPELAPTTTDRIDPRNIIPDVPEDLAQLCIDTLSTDRTAGPRTAGDVVAALTPWGAVTATPPPVFSAVHGVAPTPAAADHAPRRVVRQSFRTGAASAPSPEGTPPPAVPNRRVQRTSVLSAGAGGADAAGVATLAEGARPAESAGEPRLPAGPAMSFDELIATPQEYRRFRFDPTAFTLVLVLVAVLVGVFLAFRNVSDGLTSPFADQNTERPVPTDPTDDGAAVDPEPETSPAATEEAAARPVIVSGRQLDPQGDGNEHPEAVDRAIDADPASFWFTRTYNSPTFAGMSRTGIGYAVELEEPALVSTIYLSTNNTGGRVEVRAVNPDDPTQGEPLAVAEFAPEMTITLDEPVETQSIVLWFPELPQTSDGSNRVELRDVSIT